MLINFSNHPSAFWSAEQREAAEKQFGEIVDLPFPAVNPEGDEDYIQALAEEYLQKVRGIAGQARNDARTRHAVLDTASPDYREIAGQALNDGSVVIHIMGELTFTYAMVKTLKQNGFTCVASTTERVAKEKNGVKTSEFRFVKFREYT